MASIRTVPVVPSMSKTALGGSALAKALVAPRLAALLAARYSAAFSALDLLARAS